MRINISDDRKRLLISIASALIIHVAVLILTGMNRPDFYSPVEFGPITVEISLDKPQITNPPEPETAQVEAFIAEEAPPVVTIKEELVLAAEPVPEKIIKPVPAPPKAVVVAAKPHGYTPENVDDSFIEALKQRSSTGGIDAREVFGADRVPSSTDKPNLPEAAGSSVGSEVVLSNVPAAVQNNVSATPDQPAEVSVLGDNDLRSLDRSLSTGSAGIVPNAAVITAAASTPQSGPVSGQSTKLTFDNPSLSRKLLKSPQPEIPSDVQKAGIPRYTVVIEFYIDSEGFTSESRIIQPSTDTRIDAAVQKAIRAWSFAESSSVGSKKVRAVLTYVIEIK